MADSAAHDAKIRRLVRTRDVDGILTIYEPLARWIARQYFALGLTEEDLIQEARWGLAKAARDFHGPGSSFYSFARLCIERQVLTAVKTAQRYKHRPLNTGKSFATSAGDGSRATLADVIPLHGSDPAERHAVKEQLAALLGALDDRLSPLERTCLLAVRLGGFSYEDLSAVTGLRLKTIDNALQRAKRKLGQLEAA